MRTFQTNPLAPSAHRLRIITRAATVALGLVSLTLAACAKDRPAADTAAAAGQSEPSKGMAAMNDMKGMQKDDSGGMGVMQGMGGDSGSMGGMSGMGSMMGMMADMQKQMDAMMKVSPDRMKAMMSAHRQMVANMLSGMTSEMRKMNMTGDAAWNATIDSVRQDLARMPDMSGKEMTAAMPAHHGRIGRLMAMHQAMAKMKM